MTLCLYIAAYSTCRPSTVHDVDAVCACAWRREPSTRRITFPRRTDHVTTCRLRLLDLLRSVVPQCHRTLSRTVNSRVLGIVTQEKSWRTWCDRQVFTQFINVSRLDLKIPIDRRPDAARERHLRSALTPLSASHTHTPRRESGRCWASTLLCVRVSTNSAKCSSHPRPSPGRAPRTRSTLDKLWCGRAGLA